MTKKISEGLREEMDELLSKAYEEGRAKGIAEVKRETDGFTKTYEDRDAKVGETIVIVDRHVTEKRYENGDTFVVRRVYGNGAVRVTVDGRPDPVLALRSEYNVLVEDTSHIKTEDKTAKVGDKILVVDAEESNGLYINGNILEVSRVSLTGGVGVALDGGEDAYLYRSEYEVVVEDTPRVETVERVVKEGDKIIIVNSFASEARYSDGDVLEVVYNYENVGDVEARLPNGGEVFVLGSEYEVIETASEDKTAKVGDIILIVNAKHTHGLYGNGDIFEVARVNIVGGVGVFVGKGGEGVYIHRSEYEVVLDGQEECGEDLSSNQRRAALIKGAKEYVKALEGNGIIRLDAVNFMGSQYTTWGDSGMMATCRVEYVVNEDKRTVVALLKGELTGCLYAKGIAKCIPGEVFNADIGKAIALPRALSKDVPSDFTNAIQPDEVVVGMEVETYYNGGGVNKTCPTTVTGIYQDKYPSFSNGTHSSIFAITEDTNAVYTKS